MKIGNVKEENFHIFWINWGISRKFSGKMWIKIILKVRKKQGFILSLKKKVFWKNHRGSQIDPPPSSLFRVKLYRDSALLLKQMQKIAKLWPLMIHSLSWEGKLFTNFHRCFFKLLNASNFTLLIQIEPYARRNCKKLSEGQGPQLYQKKCHHECFSLNLAKSLRTIIL